MKAQITEANEANLTCSSPNWGATPWNIDFRPEIHPLPESVDVAIIGGGFSGLSAAAALRRLDSRKSVAVFEAHRIGARSSGHTGGLTLAETAAGNLPGLGDVLSGLIRIVQELEIECDLTLPGVWELDRFTQTHDSPIRWSDSGELRAAREVPGGTLDPGKLVSGLARAAHRSGAHIFENAGVHQVDFGRPLTLHLQDQEIHAGKVLFATNSESLELNGLIGQAEPKLTLALATEPLPDKSLDALGWSAGKPFYTVDFPYLWGRRWGTNRTIWGSGLVGVKNWRDLTSLDVGSGETLFLLDRLERRVKHLHATLSEVEVTHRWGGPILIGRGMLPVFRRHPQSRDAVVLGAYSGHGVALSVYLGAWAAEVLLEQRNLPDWSSD